MAEAHSDERPLLQYADAPARHGIIFEASAGGLTITIPVPLWQQLSIYAGVAVVLGIAFLVHAIVAVTVLAFGLVLAAYHRRLARPMIIELTATELRFINMSSGEQECDRTLPRADVYDVKFVRHSGNLVVRTHGQEMLEVRPSRDEAIMVWLAETIRQALWPQPPSET